MRKKRWKAPKILIHKLDDKKNKKIQMGVETCNPYGCPTYPPTGEVCPE